MSTEPEITHLLAVERWTQVLAALLIGVGLLFLPVRAQLGLCVGAGLMVLNTWLIRRLGARLGLAFGGGRKPSLGLVLFLFNFKLVLLAALLYLGIRFLPVDPLALVVGVSVLPVAILIRAVQHALRDDRSTPTSTNKGEEG